MALRAPGRRKRDDNPQTRQMLRTLRWAWAPRGADELGSGVGGSGDREAAEESPPASGPPLRPPRPARVSLLSRNPSPRPRPPLGPSQDLPLRPFPPERELRRPGSQGACHHAPQPPRPAPRRALALPPRGRRARARGAQRDHRERRGGSLERKEPGAPGGGKDGVASVGE